MKALVLSAGYGTRLGSLTAEIPKPMLPLAGKPLLQYTIEHLAGQGITEIAINLHFRPEVIQSAFGDGSQLGVNIHYSFEEKLLGTAGSVLSLREFFEPDEYFLVQYGDLLTNQRMAPLVELHRRQDAYATLVVHQRVGSNSVLALDEDQRIVEFVERPESSDEHTNAAEASWVNSGIQILSRAVLEDIPDHAPADLPRDVYVPRVHDRRLFGCPLAGYRCAIDSPQRYAEARRAILDGRLADPGQSIGGP